MPADHLQSKYQLARAHRKAFGHFPEVVVFAPGRVNLIGEHTDYNGGFVLPFALEQGIYAAVSKNGRRTLNLLSLDFKARTSVPFDNLLPDPSIPWANLIKGVVKGVLGKEPHLSGINLSLLGNLPMGAGLSSSAAAAVAAAVALQRFFELPLPAEEIARLCQRAEHGFTGAQCGLMDQMISLLGRENEALFLRCADLTYQYHPLELKGVALIVTQSGVKHSLATGEYNTRRRETEALLPLVAPFKPKLQHLSELSLAEFHAFKNKLPAHLLPRLRHVLTENARVLQMGMALSGNHLEKAGRLLFDSHASLRDDYQVSCPELDFLVDTAQSVPGVYGARMTGGGFGGCTIALMKNEAVEPYRKALKLYKKRFDRTAEVWDAVPSAGAQEI